MEKFKKPRLLTPRGQSHKKFWQAVGLCALTAAIFFLPFYILDGGFFHYAGDFNSQQITFYRYMNGFVKGAGYPDSAFAGAPHNTFSWATDLGSGVMNAYSFYLYGSPFFWLSVLLPQSWLPYMMVPLLVLKFGVAGGGAFLYLRRYVKNENYAVLGACLYALSGFAVYNVFFNHFVDVVALFPYLLWALDEAIYENRHGLFAFWVAVNLLNNYFFFVGQVIFLCIYFVCKLTAKDFRLTGRKFGHLLWESVLGVAMGCLLLFPAVLSLLQNPRTIDLSSGWGFLTYAKVQQYLAILLSWILPPDSPYLTSVWSEGVIKWIHKERKTAAAETICGSPTGYRRGARHEKEFMNLTAQETVKAICEALIEKKAQGIEVLHVERLTELTEYFVICSATSTTQVKALADNVEWHLKYDHDEMPHHTEGYESAQWMLLDYGCAVLHVFMPEARKFYNLENLWKDGTPVTLAELGIEDK